ncbi:MAG TPA: hypothetical protein PLS94_08730 [Prolixibacteraceae bacterium]|nr:hypothetical protein [Prolixibacteraceae bacterium]
MKTKRYHILLILIIVHIQQVTAQGWKDETNTIETNWNFTVQLGGTALLSEINKDFSGSNNDMNNLPDWGINFQLAKMLIDQFEAGVEFGFSNYKGYKNHSANVNWLNLHNDFNNEEVDFQPYAIFYDSDLINLTIFGKYNFINFRTWSKGYLKLNLYFKLGMGLGLPSVEMGYTDIKNYELTGLSHPLYLKGRYPRPERDVHGFLSPALGLNYQMSEKLFFSAETSLQFIAADNIDGIHNFGNNLKPELSDEVAAAHRIRVNDMTAKFLIGITYYFNFDTTKGIREKQNPFFKKRSESYYQKYHQEGEIPNAPKSKKSKR